MESQKQSHQRKLNELLEENDFLFRENQKLKKTLGLKDDDGVIDLDEDSEEEYDQQGQSSNFNDFGEGEKENCN